MLFAEAKGSVPNYIHLSNTHNSWPTYDPTRTEFNKYFIVYLQLYRTQGKRL